MAYDNNTPPNFPFMRQATVVGNLVADPYFNGKPGRSAFAAVKLALNARYDGYETPMYISVQLFGGMAEYASTLKKEKGKSVRIFATGDFTAKPFTTNKDVEPSPEDYDENPDDYGLDRLLTNVSAFGLDQRWFSVEDSEDNEDRPRSRRSRDDNDEADEAPRSRRRRSSDDDNSGDDAEEAPRTSRRRRSAPAEDAPAAEEDAPRAPRRRRSKVQDEGDE